MASISQGKHLCQLHLVSNNILHLRRGSLEMTLSDPALHHNSLSLVIEEEARLLRTLRAGFNFPFNLRLKLPDFKCFSNAQNIYCVAKIRENGGTKCRDQHFRPIVLCYNTSIIPFICRKIYKTHWWIFFHNESA